MKHRNAVSYELVRYASEPRIVVVPPEGGKASPQVGFCKFSTIAAHLYRGTYYAGSHHREDCETTGTIIRRRETLCFEMTMMEPSMPGADRTAIDGRDKTAFWEGDFVSLNFVDAADLVCQVALKPDGTMRCFRNGVPAIAAKVTAEVVRHGDRWTATVVIPARFLGRDVLDLEACPIPFDVVRLRSASAAVTAWCPIQDSLPFNEQYRFPVFHFGLLCGCATRWPAHAPKQTDIGGLARRGSRKIQAGAYARHTLVYTAGRHGLKRGGAIKFNLSNEVIECDRRSTVKHPLPEKDWSPLQWENSRAPGYVSVSCSRRAAKFRLEKNDVFSTTLRLIDGKGLVHGDRVVIRIGADPSGPGMRTQLLAQNSFPSKYFVDVLGNGVFLAPMSFPTVDVVGRPVQRLLLHAQPTPDPGERFRLVVVAIDDYGNIANTFHGVVRFFAPTPIRGLPKTCRFSKADGGIKELRVAIPTRGAFTLQAVADGNPAIHGTSNLIVTDGSFGPGKIFFGDIHTHSQLSDGRLNPTDKASEVSLHRGCDFWALTDHCHDLTPHNLDHLNRVVARFNRSGSFVTLPAYEWTGSMGQGRPTSRGRYGHRNVYFKGPIREVVDAVDPRGDTPEKLKVALRRSRQEAVIINHFHCGDPAMFEDVDADVEISSWCSFHNRESRQANTAPGGYNLQDDVFARGLRVGVVAGSDHGTEGYYTGLPAELTAVYTGHLDRASVFAALKDGRTYATSGQKLLLAFSINGRTTSRSGRLVSSAVRRLKVVIGSAMPVQRVLVIRNGVVWKDFGGFEFGVKTFVVRDDEPMKGGGYYYIRVHSAQGHVTWSSPVYVVAAKGRNLGLRGNSKRKV